MGGCMTRLKAEMKPPPPRSGNWEGLSPQRPEPYVHSKHKEEKKEEEKKEVEELAKDANGAPLRRETQSGVPGLTYDQAGRPVWREENSVQVEHREQMQYL